MTAYLLLALSSAAVSSLLLGAPRLSSVLGWSALVVAAIWGVGHLRAEGLRRWSDPNERT